MLIQYVYVTQMHGLHVNMIASSVKIINKLNVFAMYRFESAMMVSCLDLSVFSDCSLPMQLLLKSLSSAGGDRSFSPCTDSPHELRDV